MGIQWDTEHLVYSGGSRGYAQCAPTMAATGEDEPLVGAVGGVNESVATEHLSDVKWRDDAFPPPTGLNSFVFAFIFAKKRPHQSSVLPPPPNGKSWIHHWSTLVLQCYFLFSYGMYPIFLQNMNFNLTFSYFLIMAQPP